MVKKVFITGGLGQIGSHTAEMLLDRGDQVLVVDNLATGRSEHLLPHPNLRVVIDSIANRAAMQALMDDFRPDAVVHTAASYKDPHDWHNDTLTNCVGGAAIASLATAFASPADAVAGFRLVGAEGSAAIACAAELSLE